MELIGREVVSLDGELGDRKVNRFLEHVATRLGPLGAVDQWTAVPGNHMASLSHAGRGVRDTLEQGGGATLGVATAAAVTWAIGVTVRTAR